MIADTPSVDTRQDDEQGPLPFEITEADVLTAQAEAEKDEQLTDDEKLAQLEELTPTIQALAGLSVESVIYAAQMAVRYWHNKYIIEALGEWGLRSPRKLRAAMLRGYFTRWKESQMDLTDILCRVEVAGLPEDVAPIVLEKMKRQAMTLRMVKAYVKELREQLRHTPRRETLNQIFKRIDSLTTYYRFDMKYQAGSWIVSFESDFAKVASTQVKRIDALRLAIQVAEQELEKHKKEEQASG
jgi:hypothetical protein